MEGWRGGGLWRDGEVRLWRDGEVRLWRVWGLLKCEVVESGYVEVGLMEGWRREVVRRLGVDEEAGLVKSSWCMGAGYSLI